MADGYRNGSQYNALNVNLSNIDCARLYINDTMHDSIWEYEKITSRTHGASS